ncbi:MAG: Hpt domain-containing protein [Rhodospirillales bacterium]|nr:Hpt domain-containing protein [Rhodospirillales bacterium]MCW8860882.1 Hpt domain-containing protein [Rhodospirillales bacterium]MCW9040597.1 Hpt domain-containing protein [Rhodospirillales bacterium]
MSEEDDNTFEKPSVITPPNPLKAKVGPPMPGGVDMAALERAEKLIAGMSDSYLEWAQEDLKKLQAAYDDLVKHGSKKEQIKQVFEIAHDIKGQGGSFGYDLMTIVGNQLCRFTEKKEELGPKELQVVKVHIDTLRVIIGERMKGDGGKAGQNLLKGLDMVVEKVTK